MFAGAYYLLFRASIEKQGWNACFFFQEKTEENQINNTRNSLQEQLKDLEENRLLYSTCLDDITRCDFVLAQKHFADDRVPMARTSSYIYKYEIQTYIIEKAIFAYEKLTIRVISTGKETVNSRELKEDGTERTGDIKRDARSFIKDLLEETQQKITTVSRRLEGVNSAKPKGHVWGFWDFFYFSVITQCTVGYGDILPNTTLIRMLVALQIIVGLFLMGIVINIIMTRNA